MVITKMVAGPQLCFAPSRPSHHYLSESNSRLLAHLSVDKGPSRHLSPSTAILLVAEQVSPHKVHRSSASAARNLLPSEIYQARRPKSELRS
jgi:hypothetical protein